jgi:hypothetical protein
MDYTYIERIIDTPSYCVNIVEDMKGQRSYELMKYEEKETFYSTSIEEINEEIESYLAFNYRVNGAE